MRRLLILLGIFIGVLLLVGAAILFLVDVNQFRGPIQSQLEKQLHRSVTLGAMSLKLFPLAVRIENVAIGDDPRFGSSTAFVAARELDVHLGLMALLQKRVEVDSLRVAQPAVELIRGRDGKWNFATIGDTGSGGAAGGGSSEVTLADLRIEDGRIAVTDQEAGKPRAVYDHVDLALRDFAPGRRFALEGRIRLPAPEKAELSLKAEGGPLATEIPVKGTLTYAAPSFPKPLDVDFDLRHDRGTGVLTVASLVAKLAGVAVSGSGSAKLKETPVAIHADLRTENAPLAEILRYAAGDSLSGSGTLSLALKIDGTTEKYTYSGKGRIANASLKPSSLKKPLEIASADIQLAPGRVGVENVAGALGGSHFRGGATLVGESASQLQFHAEIDKADLAELQNLAETPPSGKPQRASKPLAGSGTLSIGTLTYNQLVLTQVQATCHLDGGIVRFDPLTAQLFGGQHIGSLEIDTRATPPAIALISKLVHVDANQLLSSTTSLRQTFYGLLAGDANLRLAPKPNQDFARGLNGSLKLQVTDGKLTGVQLLNEMAGLGKFLGYAKRNETFTRIVKLTGTLNIEDGVARTNDLQMEFDGGSLTAEGTAGLADQTLNLRLTTVLAKDVSQRSGGNQVGGFLTTVLANPKGELVIPALVSGTFAKPVFAPDPQRVAKMKLGGLLPSKENPKAAIGGVIDAIQGKKPEEGGQPNQLRNMLDSFRKKKEPKQP